MNSDQNLLFGVVALQVDLIDARQFAEACSAWAARKHSPLADVLVERGWIAPADRDDLERIVHRKLGRHGGDSLATIASLADARLRAAVSLVDDPTVRATLTGLPSVAQPVSVGTGLPPAGRSSRYSMKRIHAEGGLGRVWLARDHDLNRDVAVKELQPREAAIPAAWQRFLKEAQITGQLEHPHIVPVYELGLKPEDGQPFYAMRFIHGQSLRDAIRGLTADRRAGRFDSLGFRRLWGALVAVCRAIDYAHSRGVLHRDLKPDNIVLGDFGEVVVLDWGLAKLKDKQDERAVTVNLAEAASASKTVVGGVLGTPAYMAPEQAEGRQEAVDERTDVYGLGAVLFEAISGRPPHVGADTAEILSRIANQETPRVGELESNVPNSLDAVCARAMAKDPSQRYRSAGDLADDLEHWLADEPVGARRDAFAERAARWARRHRAWTRAAAAALCLVTLVSVAAAVTVDQARRAEQVAKDETRLSLAAETVAKENAGNALVAERLAKEEARRSLAAERLAKDQARQAVKNYVDLVTQEELLKEERFQPLRRKLLKDALDYYESFIHQQADNPQAARDLADAFHEIGAINESSASKADALVSFVKARDLYEGLLQRTPTETSLLMPLFRTYNELALLQQATGPHAEALASYRRASEIAERLLKLDPDHGHFRESLGLVTHNMGVLYCITGQFDDAIEALDRSRAAYELALKPTPNDPGLLGHLAATHGELGLVYISRGGPLLDQALVSLDASRQIRERLLEADPSSLEIKCALARTYANLSMLHGTRGEVDEQLSARERAVAMNRELVVARPNVTEYQSDLAGQCTNLSHLKMLSGDLPECFALLDEAETTQRRLVAEHPGILDFKSELAATLHHRGMALVNDNRGEQAVAVYREAIVAQRIAYDAAPKVTQFRDFLGNHYHELAALLASLDRNDEASDAFREAVGLRADLVRDQPFVANWYVKLGQALAGWSPILARIENAAAGDEIARLSAESLRAAELARSTAADFTADFTEELMSMNPRILAQIDRRVGRQP